MFYRLNKKQRISFELVAIERRVIDVNAPIGGVLQPASPKVPIALVPQDIPATAVLKRNVVQAGTAASISSIDTSSFSFAASPVLRPVLDTDSIFTGPIDNTTRARALKDVDDQLKAINLINKDGKVSTETTQKINFEMEFSLPTSGIIVKGCLDDCDVCEPLLKERMQLENDLLRKQIDLLEKSQEYRCCPPAPVINGD